MRVVVPSLGRAGTSASMEWLRDAGRRRVVLAVHRDEATLYKRAYPWAVTMAVPESCRGHAGRLRQYIMRTMGEPFIFVDDDISVRLVYVRTHAVMLDVLEKHVQEGAAMAAIGKQIFSNGVIPRCGRIGSDPVAIRNQFASTVYAIDPVKFETCPLDKLQVYEDCALVIHAARHGGVVVSYCATHTNKSPPAGGCNSWRTEAVVRDSMEALARLYPDVVRIIETRHTAHGHALGIGVRVAWSRL